MLVKKNFLFRFLTQNLIILTEYNQQNIYNLRFYYMFKKKK